MAQNIPTELRYTKDHEWTKIEGDTVVIGITDFAQSALGDIVFVELPEVGKVLSAHQTFGVVESIKSVSDLYTPLSGTVIEVNSDLQNTPELCNAEPYGSAWMIKVKLSQKDELNSLLSATDYQNFLSTL
ncbi:MAG: glycine cleavage system protein GcvH [Bacteriovorax sp.]|jgi:glycine cleavage system H protein|nr:glycine cleavage system protein GcvH [Bacteriovorax sp.]